MTKLLDTFEPSHRPRVVRQKEMVASGYRARPWLDVRQLFVQSLEQPGYEG